MAVAVVMLLFMGMAVSVVVFIFVTLVVPGVMFPMRMIVVVRPMRVAVTIASPSEVIDQEPNP